jgi:hypothetical protein
MSARAGSFLVALSAFYSWKNRCVWRNGSVQQKQWNQKDKSGNSVNSGASVSLFSLAARMARYPPSAVRVPAAREREHKNPDFALRERAGRNPFISLGPSVIAVAAHRICCCAFHFCATDLRPNVRNRRQAAGNSKVGPMGLNHEPRIKTIN